MEHMKIKNGRTFPVSWTFCSLRIYSSQVVSMQRQCVCLNVLIKSVVSQLAFLKKVLVTRPVLCLCLSEYG